MHWLNSPNKSLRVRTAFRGLIHQDVGAEGRELCFEAARTRPVKRTCRPVVYSTLAVVTGGVKILFSLGNYQTNPSSDHSTVSQVLQPLFVLLASSNRQDLGCQVVYLKEEN